MSRVAGTQFSIGSSTRRCCASERELHTGDRFVAVLVQHIESDELVRMDFCEDAWMAGSRPPRQCIVFGLWRGVVPDPTAKKKMLIDDQSLLELFEQTAEPFADPEIAPSASSASTSGEPSGASAEATERERLAFRFVLALILMRKRLLIGEGQRERSMLVRPRGTPKPPDGPELIEVVDPGLDEATIVRVTQRLSAVIAGDTVPAGAVGGKS